MTLGFLSGNVYLGSPMTDLNTKPVKMEIDSGEWKLIGYVKDIELSTDNEYDLIETDYSFDSFRTLKNQKHTITAEFTYGPESNHLWTLLTGQALSGLSIAPVERLKRLIHGPH